MCLQNLSTCARWSTVFGIQYSALRIFTRAHSAQQCNGHLVGVDCSQLVVLSCFQCILYSHGPLMYRCMLGSSVTTNYPDPPPFLCDAGIRGGTGTFGAFQEQCIWNNGVFESIDGLPLLSQCVESVVLCTGHGSLIPWPCLLRAILFISPVSLWWMGSEFVPRRRVPGGAACPHLHPQTG